MTIKICTTNTNKIREFGRILGFSPEPVDLVLEEIQTLNTEEVCRKKAAAAFAEIRQPVLVDDTGFELASLGGFPGALVTWAINAGTTKILHRMLPADSDKNATIITAIGYATAAGVFVFSGRLEGLVIATPRGRNGFGFDDIFVPAGETRTLAEMSDAEKDAVSPRSVALQSLATFIGREGR